MFLFTGVDFVRYRSSITHEVDVINALYNRVGLAISYIFLIRVYIKCGAFRLVHCLKTFTALACYLSVYVPECTTFDVYSYKNISNRQTYFVV